MENELDFVNDLIQGLEDINSNSSNTYQARATINYVNSEYSCYPFSFYDGCEDNNSEKKQGFGSKVWESIKRILSGIFSFFLKQNKENRVLLDELAKKANDVLEKAKDLDKEVKTAQALEDLDTFKGVFVSLKDVMEGKIEDENMFQSIVRKIKDLQGKDTTTNFRNECKNELAVANACINDIEKIIGELKSVKSKRDACKFLVNSSNSLVKLITDLGCDKLAKDVEKQADEMVKVAAERGGNAGRELAIQIKADFLKEMTKLYNKVVSFIKSLSSLIK